ncbi:hypothetical protein C2S52_003506 [Perilla frutescens var. hirtella]|nr:hypothetical protein C2S51_012001 [Perilla frutescens var. frutescens]KAH6793029.1 hypothetical protein C2S52_003506 [Perilla frutescens var. hirtella]
MLDISILARTYFEVTQLLTLIENKVILAFSYPSVYGFQLNRVWLLSISVTGFHLHIYFFTKLFILHVVCLHLIVAFGTGSGNVEWQGNSPLAELATIQHNDFLLPKENYAVIVLHFVLFAPRR